MEAQRLTVDGVEVVVEGEGPHTVMMIHGWPDSYRLWDGVVATLKGQYRCVRFTLPGYAPGQPRKARPLAELVALFGKIADTVSPHGKITLMVHDWGAIFGYEYAMSQPQRIARLVGVDIGDANSPDYMRALTAKAKWQIFSYQIWLASAWVLRGALGDRMSRYMARQLRCKVDPALIHCNMNYPYFIQWTGTHGGYGKRHQVRPDCPTLFLYGIKKPFMFHSEAWVGWLRSKPGNEVHAVKSGHWVMVDQAEQFNQLVGDWLARTPAV
jgi:pimeloyl-ACP methyl ester carboxylesterase